MTDKLRYADVNLLRNRSDTYKVIQKFVRGKKNEVEPIHRFLSDNGGEFINNGL